MFVPGFSQLRVGEVAGVAAQVGHGPRPDDGGAELPDMRQQGVDLFRGANIVREREAGKHRVLRREPLVGRQALALPERKPGFPHLEEGHGRGRLEPGKTQALFVETDGPFQVGDAERDEADARFHPELTSF